MHTQRVRTSGSGLGILTAATVTVLTTFGLTPVVNAASQTWLQAAADGTFTTPGNWVGGAVPGGSGTTNSTDTATFGRNSASSATVTVDANRNLQNITFNPSNAGATSFAYNITGGPLVLTSGGAITAGGTGLNPSSISANLNLQGDGGTYTIQADLPSTRVFTIAGAVSGVSTGTNVTALTLAGSSGTGTHLVNGAITDGAGGGKLSITKSGTGTWSLTNGGNTYSGGTTINSGTVIAGSATPASQIGTGAVTLNGGTLRMSATSSTFSNALVVGSAGGFVSTKGHTFNPSSVTGTGVLSFGSDAGTLITPSGTGMNGFAGTVNVVTAGLRLGTSLTNWDAANGLASAVLNITATGNVTRGFGTNGAQTVNIGTLSGAGGTIGGTSSAGTGLFTYSVGGRNEDSTFSGVILDGLTKSALTKIGTGAMTLTNTNTYTGATTVTGGKLLVNGSLAAGSAVSVSGTGTLGGSGFVNGSVAINSGGTLAPGNSIDSIDTGNLTFGAGSHYAVELNATTVTSDVTNVTGTVALDIGALLDAPSLTGTLAASQVYVIIANDDVDPVGGTAGIFDSYVQDATVFTQDGFDLKISYVGDSGAVAATGGNDVVLYTSPIAIPEPATLGLIGLVGATLLTSRRRRVK